MHNLSFAQPTWESDTGVRCPSPIERRSSFGRILWCLWAQWGWKIHLHQTPYRPTSTIDWSNRSVGVDAKQSPQKLKANIGIVPESESPPSFLTPTEFLQFVARLRGLENLDEQVEYWLDWFGLQEKRDTMCKDLSKGQR